VKLPFLAAAHAAIGAVALEEWKEAVHARSQQEERKGHGRNYAGDPDHCSRKPKNHIPPKHAVKPR